MLQENTTLVTWFYNDLTMIVGNVTFTGDAALEAESYVDAGEWTDVAPGCAIVGLAAHRVADILDVGDDFDAHVDALAAEFEYRRWLIAA